MADMGDAIQKILGDPKSMEMLSGLLAEFGDKKEKPEHDKPERHESKHRQPEHHEPKHRQPEHCEPKHAVPDLRELEQMSHIIKRLQGPPDDRCCLLMALKPFVSPERCKKIDQSVEILKLLNIADALGGAGLV